MMDEQSEMLRQVCEIEHVIFVKLSVETLGVRSFRERKDECYYDGDDDDVVKGDNDSDKEDKEDKYGDGDDDA